MRHTIRGILIGMAVFTSLINIGCDNTNFSSGASNSKKERQTPAEQEIEVEDPPVINEVKVDEAIEKDETPDDEEKVVEVDEEPRKYG